MAEFRCRICNRVFSNLSGLTRHANAMHHGKTSLSQTQQSIQSPDHDTNLWSLPISMSTSISSTSAEKPTSQVDMITDKNYESEPQYNLRSQIESESEEIIEENIEAMEIDLTFEDNELEPEDL
jgi:hypothetical protein